MSQTMMMMTKSKKPTSFSVKSRLSASFIFLAVGFLLFAGQANASSISIDFEDYQTGGLDGQKNWTAGQTCFITDSEKYSGTKSLLMEGNCYLAYLSITYPETGSLSFYTKKVFSSSGSIGVGGLPTLFIQEAGETEIGFEQDPEDYFFEANSLGINNLQWNNFIFEWKPEGENHLVRSFKNGDLIIDWTLTSEPFFTDTLYLNNNAGNYYIDDIVLTDLSLVIGSTGQLFNMPAELVAQMTGTADSLIDGLSAHFALLVGIILAMFLIEWLIGLVERKTEKRR